MKIVSARAISYLFGIALVALLSACGGGGSGTTTTTPPPVVTPPPAAAAISLSASLTSVASDNSKSTTITATVVDAANAAVPGVTIAFSADTGFLSLGSAVSDASGKATVTFSSGSNPASRTATITATASGKSTQIPIRVTGATIDVSAISTSLIAGGAPTTLTLTVKGASGALLSGQAVTIASSGTGGVTVSPTTGTTDSSGKLTATVTPVTAGTVTVTVSAVGETRTLAFTISGTTLGFQITSLSSDPSKNGFTIGVPVIVTVQVPPPTTTVVFVTTLGNWVPVSGTPINTIAVSVIGGTASATLISNLAGVANIQVYDQARQATINDSRVVSFTSATAGKITLQASPSVVAPSSGGTSGIATLLATVTDLAGNPVGNAAVAFQILNPTGGGETISPAVVLTSPVAGTGVVLGQAKTTFTAGSLPSGAAGVRIRASVVGTTVATSVSPSSSDSTITIGGTAGSVAIGRATQASEDVSGSIYILPMSVLVADSNGNPVANTTVSLSAWPIAFNNGGVDPVSKACVLLNDYYNEDVNENLILDNDASPEDGVRRIYPNGPFVSGGTLDGKLTPPNSAAGTLPATVTTDASGVATFNLTYTKSNSLWIIDRIRARTFVQGTETVGQVEFRLPALDRDIGPPCRIPSSPYLF